MSVGRLIRHEYHTVAIAGQVTNMKAHHPSTSGPGKKKSRTAILMERVRDSYKRHTQTTKTGTTQAHLPVRLKSGIIRRTAKPNQKPHERFNHETANNLGSLTENSRLNK